MNLESMACESESAEDFLSAVEEKMAQEAQDDWFDLNDLYTDERQRDEWREAEAVSNRHFGDDETFNALRSLGRS